MTFIYFLLLLTIIICIHEAGHLIAAKIFNVYCFEYSFGMGPALLQKKGKETVYSLRAIPMGGFVSMAGEADADEAYPDVVVPDDRRLINQKPWKRVIIMLAGVFMNFMLALLIFSMIFLKNGIYVESPKPIAATIKADSPAEKAGFKPGDLIVKIESEDGNTMRPSSYVDLQIFLLQNTDQQLTYTVDRNGEVLDLKVTPEFDEETQSTIIGITSPSPETKDVNFLNCWAYGLKEMKMIMKLLVTTLLSLFRGNGLNQLSGPVGIYNATEQYVSLGLTSYLFLIAELSINVGIFNLLPLPVLDGGQVVITIGEAVAGKKLNDKIKLALMGACWIMLIGIMVFATWNDIVRLIG